MKRTRKEKRIPRRRVGEILGDRALMAGLLFSVVVHLVVFFQVPWPYGDSLKVERPIMIARLIRTTAGAPVVTGKELPPAEAEKAPAALPPAESSATGGAVRDEEIGVAARGTPSAGTAGASGGASLAFLSRPTLFAASLFPAQPAAPPVGSARVSITGNASRERSVISALDEIRRRIESRKSYPRLARRNGWEGRVLVELSLAEGGALEDVRIVNASGYRILDSATVHAVRSAGPFPPVKGRVRVPVTYRLQK